MHISSLLYKFVQREPETLEWSGVWNHGILLVRHTGGQNRERSPQQHDQDGHLDKEAEIELLCVKHTLLVVA